MLGRLFLLFTLVPLAELYLLVTLGGLMGVGPTIALVAVTGMFGAWLARREGRRALASYQAAMQRGQLPEDGIISGLLILAGGVMLITPGILTDIGGLALMVPPLRRGVAKLIKRRLQAGIASGNVQVMHLGPAGFGSFDPSEMRGGFESGHPGPGGVRGGIVDVEVVETQTTESSGERPDLARRP